MLQFETSSRIMLLESGYKIIVYVSRWQCQNYMTPLLQTKELKLALKIPFTIKSNKY